MYNSYYPEQHRGHSYDGDDDNDDDWLKLSLGRSYFNPPSSPTLQEFSPLTFQPFLPPPVAYYPVLAQPQQLPLLVPQLPNDPPQSHQQEVIALSRSSGSRTRRPPNQTSSEDDESKTVPAPYPWATNRKATVHSLKYLLANGITTISGEVQCKRCDKTYEMEYNLEEKFGEVASFILKNKYSMHDRAPSVWMNPTLPDCKLCNHSNSVKPVFPTEKTCINWLFLLLGQMLGCCKLSHLKHFCKHTENHRTGAKDRVLYLTYLALCKQLDPTGPFGLEH
ncbi:hypothetical protein K2173_019530 [Erythroxylum novogranatense]|uniref:DUF7086 domain-containing protein n=1 Tax=Erythroxylum novogranatense TaxID=1862640 RepID=A0AAV8UF17_9ROSI|nr:hypothetical protein K2173_019530 [Erythroxylum novogranatense]